MRQAGATTAEPASEPWWRSAPEPRDSDQRPPDRSYQPPDSNQQPARPPSGPTSPPPVESNADQKLSPASNREDEPNRYDSEQASATVGAAANQTPAKPAPDKTRSEKSTTSESPHGAPRQRRSLRKAQARFFRRREGCRETDHGWRQADRIGKGCGGHSARFNLQQKAIRRSVCGRQANCRIRGRKVGDRQPICQADEGRCSRQAGRATHNSRRYDCGCRKRSSYHGRRKVRPVRRFALQQSKQRTRGRHPKTVRAGDRGQEPVRDETTCRRPSNRWCGEAG